MGYKVITNNKGAFHKWASGKTFKVAGPHQPGFVHFDDKKRQYFQNSDDGVTAQRVYQNGLKTNQAPGSIFKGDPGLSPFYKQGVAASELKYGVPQKTIQTQMDRERGAQNQAYGQIANYYAGMAGNAQNLMSQAGQVGQQTDASLKSIGVDRNAQIQAATPQYAGPLGAVAQNMANSEQQAALNRGAAVDQSNRGMNTMTSGNRQAYLGEVGAAQQVAGQERLSTLKGQGSQALNVYGDKIAELERQKGLGAVDSAQQLRTAQQQYGLAQQRNDISQQNADTSAVRAASVGSGGGGGGGGGGNGGTSKKPKNPNLKNGITPASNNAFWQKAQTGVSILNATHQPKTTVASNQLFDFLVNQKHFSATEANVARAMWMYNGKLTPFAASAAKQSGYDVTPYGIWRP